MCVCVCATRAYGTVPLSLSRPLRYEASRERVADRRTCDGAADAHAYFLNGVGSGHRRQRCTRQCEGVEYSFAIRVGYENNRLIRICSTPFCVF